MDAPFRKKKKAVAPSGNDGGPDRLPTRRPFCPKCQYEYAANEKEQIAATLAAESKIMATCPKCGVAKVPVLDFKDTHPPPDGRKLKRGLIEPGVRAIIDSIFEVDFDRTWKILHENLVVGGGRTDHGTLTAALDHAEDNARKAHQLYVNMKLELEAFEIDRKVVWAGLYDEAHGHLQAEKKSGERTKQITDGDVEMKMAELHPDEFRAYSTDLVRFKLAAKHAENFAELWSSKCRSLQTMLAKMRGGGVA